MRLIVIGGDAAGMSAAAQARRRRGPDDLEILAFEMGRFVSYSACGIPYWIGGLVDGPDALIARTPAAFRTAGIEVRTRHEVTGIDLDARTVTVRDRDAGRTRHEGFDHLVYATGASPVRPSWAATDAGGVFGVQTLEDGSALREWLDREKPADAVVIGGGYIGVEMAEAMINRGLRVTLVERAAQPMGTVDEDMGALVAASIRNLGIELRTGVTVEGLETANGRIAAVATDAGAIPAGVVVIGLGVRPNTALAEAAGLPLGTTGGIRTDLRQRAADGVWAAGDCTEVHHRISRRAVHVPLGTHANKQGRVAGINIGGGYATFPGVIGTAVTKLCDLEVARTGLSSREAAQAGFATVTATVESTNRAGYFPGAVPMTVKVIAERDTGVLLGAQIVGRTEAAKRIDAFAVAVWNGMTVSEMTGLDLGYAPPYAPVWDPILIAARKAEEVVTRPVIR
ncbi:NADPH-dependent 2,4-dienoyl-CoA reductase/sulfur reductase-like enzyme [Actinoplanes octamycinicus]|uniref:NADPH-dependent 2,4-dienoyl-CoA reductase/sulfur reductase-like enzyme n=1 Tax=Actinoplanes octamycinicus TaxID=135948 RepID=A0A7W7M878_9ACTN|nr:FAD-dependent oxidoreductase [Actinoplanes octamycinicus]MBB4740613.1 NADPH-dependent 2,4-dienoyl-CoA reductase/sulfur reductase-like enzyme [Actinoplanes octamycinicus]GIE63084.1 flavoprotein oxidoreductase [Actinoplanes octamycinicus]